MTNDPVDKVMREVLDTTTDPRVAILVAHGLVELMINVLIEERCKNGKKIVNDTRGFPHSVRLLILHENGVLADSWYELRNRFRKLRNDAAHQPFFTVDKGQLMHVAEPWERDLPKDLNADRPSDSIGLLCGSIVQSLWQNHREVLGPRFAPRLTTSLEAMA
jgi:hypothetical protein